MPVWDSPDGPVVACREPDDPPCGHARGCGLLVGTTSSDEARAIREFRRQRRAGIPTHFGQQTLVAGWLPRSLRERIRQIEQGDA